MARKKRIPEVAVPTNDAKAAANYQDAFQSTVAKKVEDVGKTFEGKGKTILYVLAALVVVGILVFIFYRWNNNSNAQAQTALGKAIETSQAVVSESPQPAGSTIKSFKTEKERAEASITQFQAVADKFGGDVAEKAKYFIAVNKLSIDRPTAITELEGLSSANSEVGKLSKFALAQAKEADGKTDEAIALYQQLAAMDNPIIAKETINIELAKLLEKQGKKAEAADVYFNIYKTATEVKDLDGKPVPLSLTAREAKDKITELNPEKAKEVVEPTPESPMGGGQLPLGIQ